MPPDSWRQAHTSLPHPLHTLDLLVHWPFVRTRPRRAALATFLGLLRVAVPSAAAALVVVAGAAVLMGGLLGHSSMDF